MIFSIISTSSTFTSQDTIPFIFFKNILYDQFYIIKNLRSSRFIILYNPSSFGTITSGSGRFIKSCSAISSRRIIKCFSCCSSENIRLIQMFKIEIQVKRGASSRLSFSPKSACGSIGTTTIGKTHSNLHSIYT